MSLTPTLNSISVEQFFFNANWRGIKRNQSSSVNHHQQIINADDFIPNLNLPVEEFFTHHNWQGVKKMIAYSPNFNTENSSTVTTTLSLQMEVKDFFQRFPWKGEAREVKVNIAQEPIVEQKSENSPPPFTELKMNDLSDLF